MIIKLKKEGCSWSLFRDGVNTGGWLDEQAARQVFKWACEAALFFLIVTEGG